MLVKLELLFYISVFRAYCATFSDQDEIGTFWQLTDIHHDANYSQEGSSKSMCHKVSQVWQSLKHYSQYNVTPGRYGDHACDSPWALVVSAISTMKIIKPNPDFILWTGDTVAHVNDFEISPTKVFAILKNTTEFLQETFNKTVIYPSLGNHDVWPANQIPAYGPSPYFNNILDASGWNKLLLTGAQETFKKGGFYVSHTSFNLTVVTLNSILWYDQDMQVNSTDPAAQFKWLESLLKQARTSHGKVLLSGHVPPGVLARSSSNITWFMPTFNKHFSRLLQQYSDVIKAAIFGHEHTDSFRVSCKKDGNGCVPVFLAPALTPWNSSLPGLGSNNPAIRLYIYNRTSGHILNYLQYYLDLNRANIRHKADWSLEYDAMKVYNLESVSAGQLKILLGRFCDNVGSYFEKYFLFNSVSFEDVKCDMFCRRRHICAMSHVEYPDFYNCLSDSHDTSYKCWAPRKNDHDGIFRMQHFNGIYDNHHYVPAYIYAVLCVLVAVVLLLFLVMNVLYKHRSNIIFKFTQPQYTTLA